MAITLKPETEKLIKSCMKELGFQSSDEFLQIAVQNFYTAAMYEYDELDAETRAAIDASERQYARGLARSWAEVRQELFAKYTKP